MKVEVAGAFVEFVACLSVVAQAAAGAVGGTAAPARARALAIAHSQVRGWAGCGLGRASPKQETTNKNTGGVWLGVEKLTPAWPLPVRKYSCGWDGKALAQTPPWLPPRAAGPRSPERKGK